MARSMIDTARDAMALAAQVVFYGLALPVCLALIVAGGLVLLIVGDVVDNAPDWVGRPDA